MTYSKKECIFKMTRVFLASFILMGVFLLPYFAYIFGRDIPFSRTILDIGNLLWPLAIFVVLLYEDKKEKLGIWRIPSLGMNLKTVILSLALGVLWQLIILLLTSLFDAPNTDPRESYTLATLILHIFSFAIIGPIAEELLLRKWYISVMERASFGKIAIVISNALIFYAAHVGTGVWRLDTLIMAVILCLTYMRTRDIRYCVITHVTCNLLGIFSAYYFV